MAEYGIILAVILGTLAAIVYSLRVLVLMDRKLARMEAHVEALALKILREEKKELEILGVKKKVARKVKKAKPKRAKKTKKSKR